MPEDKRLWMTFPIDFWMHPKFATVSDAALRTFVEMNGYSRMQNLDGRIPIVTAKKLWRQKSIDELMSNHPERPTLTVEADAYVIRNYSQHQETSETIAARQERNRANGARGGRPRNPTETDSVSKPEPKTNPTKSRDRGRDRVNNAPSIEGASAPPKSPWCFRHPGGTDKPCGPCRTARIAFEATLKEPKTKPVTSTPKRYKPNDGHTHHVPPGGEHCELCETRVT